VTEPRETRERLVKTAERLFAERGFKRVTVREICRVARTNIASVNYHYGGKLGLYREVMRQAIESMQETTDAARTAGEGQAPEEKLRRYVVIFLRRLMSPRHKILYRLLQSEMHDPTAALDEVVELGFRPRIAYLADVVAEMIDCEPDDVRVLRCLASIQGQFAAYSPNPIAERLGFRFGGTPTQIEESARHIAEFAVAGVHAVGPHVPRGRAGV
jgi:AcrR family transcriptional regulator